ncbi:MAG: hypothetical protein J6W93_03145 [Clostridia bacterium]|nr:hypothetical protein [Clostridia bacterium]
MKKLLAILLCFVLFAACFAACGKTEEEQSKEEPVSAEQSTALSEEESSAEEESTAPVLNVEQKDYEDKEFVIMGSWHNTDYGSEIMPSEYVDDTSEFITTNVNEAIAERNRLTEDYLGVKIRELYVVSDRMSGAAAQQLRENHLAGTLGVHVVAPSIYCLGALAGEGIFADLNTIEGFDTESPWFDQSFKTTAEVNGKLFFIQGDCGLYGFNATPLVFFNKSLAAKYNLPDLYATVRNGEWTFDLVYEYSKLMSEDLNEDGLIDYRDKTGYVGQADDSWNWFYGSGEKIVDVKNGEIVLSMYNERSASVVETMNKLFSDRTLYCCANDYFNVSSDPVRELTSKMFKEGRSLFFSEIMSNIHEFSDMEDEFGVLPIPKYSVEQEDYHTLLNSWSGNAFAIPDVLSDEDRIFASECLQTFCYFSTDTVKKEYIERTLKYQKTTDENSAEMLEIIFSTRGTDLGFIYNVGSHGNATTDTSLPWLLQKMMDGSITFAAGFEARRSAAESDIENIQAMYSDS